MPPYRSPVPDLLFEDTLAERLRDLAPYLAAPEAVDQHTALHRLTVFVNYQCNLDCVYCKTIRLARPRPSTFTRAGFERWLSGFAGAPVRHLHFTGGEATLCPDLPRLIQLARARGVERISLTSNGARDWAVYQALAEAGLDELRLSLDTHEPPPGQPLTGRAGAWQSAIRNLEQLAAWRGHRPPPYLIVNTVVSEANRRTLPEIVRFFLEHGANDLKLITVVQSKRVLGAFPDAQATLAAVAALLAPYPPEAFPLLRRKLRTVFAPHSIGLEDVPRAADETWPCYIPLTERTVDSQYYYPCSVYVREGGEPIGRIDEPAATQIAQTVAFVQRSRCLADPICREYCLYCTKQFNLAANQARCP